MSDVLLLVSPGADGTWGGDSGVYRIAGVLVMEGDMFDASKYRNDMPYPSESDKDVFMSARLAELDNTPMTQAQYKMAVEVLKEAAEAHIIALRIAYSNREFDLRDQFYRDAEEDYGFGFLPDHIKSMIHGYAWDRGHSAGYEEVYNCYAAVVEIALAAHEAGQNSMA